MNKGQYAALAAGIGMAAVALPAFAATNISVVSGNVTAMATNQLTVKVGKSSYVTTESATTKYWDAGNRALAGTSIQVGDHVWVYGVKNTTAKTITGVTKVKDLSINKMTITGTVSSMATDQLKVKVGKVTYTTTESASTKYWTKAGKASTVSIIKVGDKVTVWGLVDSKTKMVTMVSNVKDKNR